MVNFPKAAMTNTLPISTIMAFSNENLKYKNGRFTLKKTKPYLEHDPKGQQSIIDFGWGQNGDLTAHYSGEWTIPKFVNSLVGSSSDKVQLTGSLRVNYVKSFQDLKLNFVNCLEDTQLLQLEPELKYGLLKCSWTVIGKFIKDGPWKFSYNLRFSNSQKVTLEAPVTIEDSYTARWTQWNRVHEYTASSSEPHDGLYEPNASASIYDIPIPSVSERRLIPVVDPVSFDPLRSDDEQSLSNEAAEG